MIYLNNKLYELKQFPNGEIIFPPFGESVVSELNIKLIYENNSELFALGIIAKRAKEIYCYVTLTMPFCPYGQADRDTDGGIGTFKYFADYINSLEFDEVLIGDPHSPIMLPLLKNSSERKSYIQAVRTIYEQDDYDYVFYPDNGAAKKYTEKFEKPYPLPYFFGYKKRNLATGEIIRYEILADEEDIRGKKVLIVDDLIVRGGTYKFAAKALKEKGVASIGLYITHIMPSAQDFYEDYKEYGIDKVYSPNTLVVPFFPSKN